jgi:GcrA cell cycle regulator
MNFAWTEERLEQFKALLGRKLTARQIAIEMGISRNAVIGKAHRSGIQLGNPVGGPHGPRGPRRSRNNSAAFAAIKARQQQEQAIRAKVTDARIKAAVVARATALGELPTCEAINLSAEPIDAPTVALLDLDNEHCRWPVDGPDGTIAQRRFCGRQTAHDLTPYCARHHAVAYIGRPGRQRGE